MVHGAGTWYMVHGTWYMVHGTRYMVQVRDVINRVQLQASVILHTKTNCLKSPNIFLFSFRLPRLPA